MLIDQQHATLLVPIPRIHCTEQARALHKPWPVIAIDVQHEDQILIFEISAYWRVMATTRSKDHLTIEIDDVSVGWIIGALQMFSKFFCTHVSEYGHAPMCLSARETSKFIQGQAHYAEASPAKARSGQNGPLACGILAGRTKH